MLSTKPFFPFLKMRVICIRIKILFIPLPHTVTLRACLNGRGGDRWGNMWRWRVKPPPPPPIMYKCDQIKMRENMDRRVITPKRLPHLWGCLTSISKNQDLGQHGSGHDFSQYRHFSLTSANPLRAFLPLWLKNSLIFKCWYLYSQLEQ